MSDQSLYLPSSMQVFERGWLSSNNILFVGPTGTALVDSGYASHASQTLALVQAALGTRPLDRLINTHLHSDHCGGNAVLQQYYRCVTIIPEDEAQAIVVWNDDALMLAATGQRCERFGFDRTLADGDTIELGGLVWQALAAPGHDPNGLVLYCPSEQILISADALWEDGFGIIFPELCGQEGFPSTAATLDLLATLPVRIVIPGHGAPFLGFEAAIARARARLEYFRADPVRHARYALKVFLKFILLEYQRLRLSEVTERFAAMTLVRQIDERFFMVGPEQLARGVIEQLVTSGAARIELEDLFNAS